MAAVPLEMTPTSWVDANRECLAQELHRIRLLMRRRACWLRQAWQEDALAAHRGVVISDARADQLFAVQGGEPERAFHRDDSESRAIDAELAALERELMQRRRNLESGGATPLAEAQELFGLSDFERDALLLAFAITEDPGIATLCAYLQDDASATRLSPHLALDVLCPQSSARTAARAALGPTGPLRHYRLLRMTREDSTATRHCLWIDERVADFLRGDNRIDGQVAPALQVPPRVAICGAQEQIVSGLVRWAGTMRARPLPPLHLTGAVGADRRAVAAEFCARVGLQLLVVDPASVPQADSDRQEFTHVLQREAALSRLAYYLDLSDIDAGDRAPAAAARDFVERFTGVLFVAGRERWRFVRPTMHVEVPRPTAAEQQSLWTGALKGVGGDVDARIGEIVQQFDFGPEAIPNVARAAIAQARLRMEPAGLSADAIWAACREHTGAQLGALAERIEPGNAWDDIVLPDDVLRQVRELADQVAARSQVYERWGFAKRFARGRGIAALFSGPSGTGKTMTAEILARHLGLDLYRIDLAGVVSKYIGETEKNLRSIFDAAEQSGAILFFDEADALFGKRTEVRDSHDRFANIEINYLLQRIEDYRGLAILCTNRRSTLDRAFLRRLRFVIEFPFPDAEHRRRIWQKMFPPEAPLGTLDFNALARLEVPGGNIRNIVINAAFLAAGAREPIAEAHLLQAARREYAKIDKLVTAAEFGSAQRPVKS